MADTKPKKRRKLKEAKAVETEPDAWERFESAVYKIAPPKRGKTMPGGEAPTMGVSAVASEIPPELERVMEDNSRALEELTSAVPD